MSKPLKLIAANDTFGALLAMTEVLEGKQAVFVTAPEVNGKMPEVFDLPDEVDDSVALIVESSGSTGKPKRIEISRDALLASAHASALAIGADENRSQWLLALPLNFIAGLNVLVRSVVAGTQPVMMNTAVPFTAEAFSQWASKMTGEKRFTALVPTQLIRLLEAANQDEFVLQQLKRFDAILIGGQAVDENLFNRARYLGLNVVVTYGMTETCGGCVYNGLPLAGVELRVDSGPIQIKGPMLANVETNDDGYFVTSDLGLIDAGGSLKVLGRVDRVIISGGLKIALDQVEQLVNPVVGVTDLAACAIDDAQWGQRVGIAYVGSPEVADTMVAQLTELLGPAGRPVRVVRVDKLPKLANGKTDLVAVKQIFQETA